MTMIAEIEDAVRRKQTAPVEDPVLAHMDFPLRRIYYPLGFPVEFATNSDEILDVVAQSWSGYPKLFDTPPIQIHIGMFEGELSACSSPPACRMQQGILTNIADAENYSVCDLTRGISTVWVTRATLAHLDYLRYCFLDAAVLCQLVTRHSTAIHGACVARNGKGILLCGDSGAGKSTLSYACAQAGWTYITDDASCLVLDRKDRMVVGNCNQARFRPPAVEFFPELHGIEVTQRIGMGKPSIEFCTTPQRHIPRAHSARIEQIVFLNRNTGARQELVPYSKEVAGHFMRGALYGCCGVEIQARQDAAIDNLLEVNVLELCYQDLGWAVERLEKLAQGKLQDRNL